MRFNSRTSRKQAKDGPAVVLAAAAVLAAIVAGPPVARALTIAFRPALYAISTVVLIFLALTLIRFARCSPAARRNYPLTIAARIRWRWTSRNLGLAHVDPHRADTDRRKKVIYPRARFRANDHGVMIRVRTTAKAARPEFERAAPYLAGMTRCERVSVASEKPGKLRLQCLRTDPLAVPYGAESVPARLRANAWRPYLGVDEWGQERHAALSGLAALLIAGNPGMGKTSGVLWLLDQLAASPAVQFAIIDGKDGGDFTAWRDRAWLSCGDELADAVAVLEDVHGEMRRRLKTLSGYGGPRNRWHCGPTAEWPLVITLIDEASTFLDMEAVKGDKEREAQVRSCRTLSGQLIKKGRAPLFLTVLISQRTTTDNTPSSLRDLCGLALCFGVSTRATAIAALGDPIKEFPSYDPSQIREPGVCTATLPCGLDPYVRLRVPEVTETAAAARARETAHLRADPTSNLGDVIPEVPALSVVAS